MEVTSFEIKLFCLFVLFKFFLAFDFSSFFFDVLLLLLLLLLTVICIELLVLLLVIELDLGDMLSVEFSLFLLPEMFASFLTL